MHAVRAWVVTRSASWMSVESRWVVMMDLCIEYPFVSRSVIR